MPRPILSTVLVAMMLISIFAVVLTPVGEAAAGPNWAITTIDSGGDVGQYCSLKVDAEGAYYISYLDATSGNLKLASNISGSANVATLESPMPGVDVGYHTSLALDSHGKVHISYEDGRGDYLFYMTDLSGRWEPTAVAAYAGTIGETAICVDGNSKAFIVYYTSIGGDLWYACNSKGTWEAHKMTINSDIGRYCAAVIDEDSRLYISYYDNTNKDLKYKYETGREENPPTVDGNGDVGQYSSIGIDGLGDPQPYISCYDVTNGDLKLAYRRWDTRLWTTYLVDSSTNDVGKYSSIGVEKNGRCHIAYYDATEGNLKYAVWDKGVSTTYVVDADGDVGQYASLSLDAKGRPSIAYYDATNGDLKIATMLGPGAVMPTTYAPEAPTDLAAVLVDNNTARLTWSAPLGNGSQSAPSGYRLYRGWDGIPARIIQLGNVTSYLDSDLPYNTTLEYWLRAVNGAGAGNSSGTINITTLAAPAITSFVAPAPSLLPNPTTGYTTVSLRWDPPVRNASSPPVSGYKLYRGSAPGSMVLTASLGNVTSYVDSGLQAGTQYYYAVTSLNAVGESGNSTTLLVTTALPPPVTQKPPQDLSWVIIVGVLALVGVVGAALFLRKKK